MRLEQLVMQSPLFGRVRMSEFFFSKNRDKAYEEIRQALYNRLQQRRNYAAQEPLKDIYFKGLQKGALSEVEFLEKLLDLIERS